MMQTRIEMLSHCEESPNLTPIDLTFSLTHDINTRVYRGGTLNRFIKYCREREANPNIKYVPDSFMKKKQGVVSCLEARPVPAIYNGLGLFVRKNKVIKKRKCLGRYLGERLNPETLNNEYGGDYVMQGVNFKKIVIDAAIKRGRLACVNHSEQANVEAMVQEYLGKEEIFYYATRDIKAEEQILINYEPDDQGNYFRYVKYKKHFMDSSDNWKTPEMFYEENQKNYCSTVFKLDKKIVMDLGFDPEQAVILPNLCKALFEENNDNFAEELEKTDNPNLYIYTLKMPDEQQLACTLNSGAEQQQITPLMLACYLGNIKAVKLLLEKDNININKQSLIDGNNALLFALLGKSNEIIKLAIIELLITKEAQLNLHNADKKKYFYTLS